MVCIAGYLINFSFNYVLDRVSSKFALGHRQVGYLALGSRRVGSPANCRWGADRSAIWRWGAPGADVSAPQEIEPTEILDTSSRVINLNISKQIINK